MSDARHARLLRSIAKVIDGAADDEVDALIKALERGTWKERKTATRSAKVRLDKRALDDRLRRLSLAQDRAAGREVLSDGDPTRTELVAIAKLANVHVTKEDSVGSIREKIVENMIGSRLNSDAIRGGFSPTKRALSGS